MADDLIPPPSPAGRPDPDAPTPRATSRRRPSAGSGSGGGGLWSGEEEATRTRNAAALAAADPAAPPDPRSTRRRPSRGARRVASPYRSRFGFLTGALIGVALAVVGRGVLLAAWSVGLERARRAGRPGSPRRTTASPPPSRSPSTSARVPPRRRQPARGGAVRPARDRRRCRCPWRCAAPPSGGDIELIDGEGVMYTLNGLGPRGSIATRHAVGGAPPAAAPRGAGARPLHLPLPRRRRHRRRAAAARAAGAGRDRASQPPQTQALFFRPGDLRGELDVPLRTHASRRRRRGPRRCRSAAPRRARSRR